MAKVTVKLFGVYRTDTHISSLPIEADTLTDVFYFLNEKVKANAPAGVKPEEIKFKDALVYVDGEKCTKKNKGLINGCEVWIMSPASGG